MRQYAYPCPFCEKPTTSRSTLEWHLRMAHDKSKQEARNVVNDNPVNVPEEKTQKQEGELVTDEKTGKKSGASFCPECLKKEFEAKLAEWDHRDEIKARDSKIADLTTGIVNLTSEITALKNRPEPSPALAPTSAMPAAPEAVHATPTVELFDHWQSCPTCKPMLDERAKEVRANVLSGLTKDEVSQAMQRHGIKPAPKEIIIKVGK